MIDFSEQLNIEIQRAVANALAEDVGTGDLTARLISPETKAHGRVITREDAVLCGTRWFDAVFRTLDPQFTVVWHAQDGERVSAGQSLCDILAPARTLLTAERTALNFLQLLSGTATTVADYVTAVAGTNAAVVDTRKTLPGLRLAQKYAVKKGGGLNHRIGLYDGVLIKENHIIAAGGVSAALMHARKLAPSNVFVEIEVETLAQLEEALAAGATMVLLDNMSLETMHEAVRINAGRPKLEASGGVSLQRVREIAETGVDRISIGALTKDVQAVDLSLRHIED
ncbi:MAG: nicotinate-nucleotide diphosphorylase (carboxylating) [Candidatus Dactylopiibacterium carminicum]|uniref:Probable nicotinate-nucleotide pyrophosphorylase [carboxylating] n=1 Tax=Candidatus Dactylopiibacterium carminicum TaxID=857335 RepID=A0A272EPM3_9RHOO|nr:carboxylating nicotinate-nucleotide diphosphorylase [Candidatus Dactylopiibacterium carminicum]KAF7599131.1 nicotinate-nucleotide diphosphorylase (carboxylating) [Candidatus Dactylopiibacterium carminicum]PAS91986.1 MAG: nicotinate-nucleotide diphosphorylase (carboxylating) [Candidatus Dactylopiibacterium carminicum]PAS95254.1 MAG: nicotinate-nucleotide diphosphorylase (carboxylating) [Candidatus Dactylopiibacterium carminicum]PAS99149.1 MAG: nicotinate-nucleotide diphosphorylase (carboxylat